MTLILLSKSYNWDGSLKWHTFGDVIQVYEDSTLFENQANIVRNGQPWPFLNVEPRKYRFRLLNGAISRGM